MKLVILESPYGNSDARAVYENVQFARLCLRDSLLRGEAPIASHLLYTQEGILRDDIPGERALGIKAGLSWRRVADYSVFYTDRGWSPGMLSALESAIQNESPFFVRGLFELPTLPPSIVRNEALHEKLFKCIQFGSLIP